MKTRIFKAAAIALLFTTSCGVSEEGSLIKELSEINVDSISNTEVKKEEKQVQTPNNWKYDVVEDKMTGEKTNFASLKSSNELNFDFPYDGGSIFDLTLRKSKEGVDAMIIVDKGQFLTGISSKKGRVKFDDKEPVYYSYVGASDASADVIFIKNSQKFINEIKASKKMMFEAEFYQSGNQIIEFDVEGLVWE